MSPSTEECCKRHSIDRSENEMISMGNSVNSQDQFGSCQKVSVQPHGETFYLVNSWKMPPCNIRLRQIGNEDVTMRWGCLGGMITSVSCHNRAVCLSNAPLQNSSGKNLCCMAELQSMLLFDNQLDRVSDHSRWTQLNPNEETPVIYASIIWSVFWLWLFFCTSWISSELIQFEWIESNTCPLVHEFPE